MALHRGDGLVELQLEHHRPDQQQSSQPAPVPAKTGRGRPRKSAAPAPAQQAADSTSSASAAGWSQTYLVTEHVVSRPGMQRAGKDVQATIVAVAFPVGAPTPLPARSSSASGSGSSSDGDSEPAMVPGASPTGRVYAYLPIHSNYGLPFELQADWVLPTSREAISESLAWNQLLREEVVPAFIAAVARAKALPSLRFAWLQFVPVPDSVDGGCSPGLVCAHV